MADRKGGCPFGDKPHLYGARHSHEYAVDRHGTRRCTCGHRKWKINTGGTLPTQVVCASCGRLNYAATAYEAGREEGPRKAVGNGNAPGF